ncbi:hypothetical protein JW887_04515 [Candidatus Dojkabacteria bacterium]|nr:hypothetical protein [Candidatus Dojkabacteria bacterium]
MKKFFIACALFIVTFVIPVLVFSVISESSGKSSENENNSANAVNSNSKKPQIVSVPVTDAYVGDFYQYKVKAVDSDGDTLSFIIKDIPSWLSWNSETQVFSGYPTVNPSGNRVEFSVSDGKWISTQNYEIMILDNSSNQNDSDNPGDSGSDDEGESNLAITQSTANSFFGEMQGDDSESNVLGAMDQKSNVAQTTIDEFYDSGDLSTFEDVDNFGNELDNLSESSKNEDESNVLGVSDVRTSFLDSGKTRLGLILILAGVSLLVFCAYQFFDSHFNISDKIWHVFFLEDEKPGGKKKIIRQRFEV